MTDFNFYPYNYPIILKDSVFVEYGGATGTSTVTQRNNAYLLSEMDVSEELNTFLLPTRVTGTYNYREISPNGITLTHRFVNSVVLTRFYDFEEDLYYTVSGTANSYVNNSNPEYGIIDIHYMMHSCKPCSSPAGGPYKIQVVYEAGFPTGIANQPSMLMALSSYATILLNEMIGYGNETVGDAAGIKQFTNQQYSETRFGLVNTKFGASPRANFIRKLLTKYKRMAYVGI